MTETSTDMTVKSTESKYWCEIRNSPVHGKGVFATKDIPANTNICIWDGEIVENLDNVDFGLVITNSQNKRISISGYKTPKTPIGIGQYINDGESFTPTDNKLAPCIEQIVNYTLGAMKKANVIYRCGINVCSVVTTKPIRKDEEIFHKYGFSFWLCQDSKENKLTDHDKKALCAIYSAAESYIEQQDSVKEMTVHILESDEPLSEKILAIDQYKTEMVCLFLATNRYRLRASYYDNKFTIMCSDAACGSDVECESDDEYKDDDECDDKYKDYSEPEPDPEPEQKHNSRKTPKSLEHLAKIEEDFEEEPE
jgi:hypothetical protein